MGKKVLIYGLLNMMWLCTVAQQVVDVTDQTIKIGGLKEEEIYFGFAQGDKILFNFKEVNGKELKEIEIVEYPANSKFSDFKSSLIQNKTLNVTRQGVYIFRFKNGAVSGRICNIQIQRVPASNESLHFNTSVSWIVKQDTVWNTFARDVIIGYDTSYVQKTKRELLKTEITEELIVDKNQRVHSQTSSNGNKSEVFFTLPQNTTDPYQSKKVVSWAYWVGVGEEANQAWKSNAQVISNVAKGAAAYFTSPLGALAVGAITDLMLPKIGEDVYYALTDQVNRNLYFAGYQFRAYDNGKGIAGFKKITEPLPTQGTFYLCMSNDNVIQAIDANVKVIAMVEVKTYQDVPYTEMVVKPRYERKLFTEPYVKTYKLPVTGL